ncbi:MAG: excinuclease ABC subunit UvrC, partial [Planctomycetes bacterium]|nr:excinuclease ABC subunit UvrC [Planctomycetota bacterium]
LDPRETWPWFRIVRKRKKEDGVFYFGPYTSATACRRTLQFLHTIFPLRTCSDHVLANRTRPCLSHEIGRCAAPCVDLVERVEYMKIVEQAILFMKGRATDLLDDLRERMRRSSEALDYETAALLRDRIRAIETTVAQPRVTRRIGGAFDVVGTYRAQDEVHLVVQCVRDGVLSASSSFRFPSWHDTDSILRSFVGQFYTGDRQVPDEIILPEECSDLRLLEESLAELRGGGVALTVPERGEKLRQLRLADRNAEIAWMQRHRDETETATVLQSLQTQLDLVHLPRRIECFDISNLMGTHVVGSCAAFTDARPDKARYRRYRIKDFEGQDDFAGMAEVIRRRLNRGLREDDLPDLIVIDGGKGQLSAAQEVLKELGVDQVDMVALAKARTGGDAPVVEKTKERVFRPGHAIPVILDQSSEELRLLTRVRDEAHRFAITYHRRLRAKSQVTSVLELVPGIGRRKAKALLDRFGNAAGVRAAADDELCTVRGVTPAIVESIRSYFARGGVVDSPGLVRDDDEET